MPVFKALLLQSASFTSNLVMTLHTQSARSTHLNAFKKTLSSLMVNGYAQFGLALIFIVLIFMLRLQFRMTDGFLWGEDPGVFIDQAYNKGIASFFTAYAGYLHALPRLIAYLLAKVTPITITPYAYVYACVLVYAACATYLFNAAKRLSGSILVAVGMACTPFLVAQSGEVYLSITNLQWVTAPVLLMLFYDTFTKGASRHAWGVRLAALFILITTGPFALLFTPVVAIVLWNNRDSLSSRYELSAMTVCAVAGFTQLTAMHFAAPVVQDPSISHDWTHFSWVDEFLRNFVLELFIPVSKIGVWWKAAALVMTAGLCLAALFSRRRLTVLALLFLAVFMWAIGVYRADTPGITVHWYGYGARYVFVPYVFVAWAMLLAQAGTLWRFRWLPILLLSLMCWTTYNSFEGGRWDKWTIEAVGNSTYKMKVAPGIEATVRDGR